MDAFISPVTVRGQGQAPISWVNLFLKNESSNPQGWQDSFERKPIPGDAAVDACAACHSERLTHRPPFIRSCIRVIRAMGCSQSQPANGASRAPRSSLRYTGGRRTSSVSQSNLCARKRPRRMTSGRKSSWLLTPEPPAQSSLRVECPAPRWEKTRIVGVA